MYCVLTIAGTLGKPNGIRLFRIDIEPWRATSKARDAKAIDRTDTSVFAERPPANEISKLNRTKNGDRKGTQ